MATFEKVIRETGRFQAVDTNGREHVVVEHTTFEVRLGFIAKPYPPVDIGRAYSLEDGRALVQGDVDEFQTLDGRLRLTRREFAFCDEESQSRSPGPDSYSDNMDNSPVVRHHVPDQPNDGPAITTGVEPGAPGTPKKCGG